MSAVTLQWITPGAEKLLAYIARVSNPDNQNNPEYERLIRYLIRNKHWSPFETVSLCVEIKTSRAISAQIIRHRSFSFQEFSQRYSEIQSIEQVQPRMKGSTNRQSSLEDIPDDVLLWFLLNEGITKDRIMSFYKEAIHKGIANESARFIMPMASSTTIYMSGTLRSWLTYLNIRLDSHTQKEHRLLANEIANILRIYFPILSDALNNFNDYKGNFI